MSYCPDCRSLHQIRVHIWSWRQSPRTTSVRRLRGASTARGATDEWGGSEHEAACGARAGRAGARARARARARRGSAARTEPLGAKAAAEEVVVQHKVGVVALAVTRAERRRQRARRGQRLAHERAACPRGGRRGETRLGRWRRRAAEATVRLQAAGGCAPEGIGAA